MSALVDAGMSRDDARRRCWLVDSRGLVVRSRTDLAEHKRPYAHDAPRAPRLARRHSRARADRPHRRQRPAVDIHARGAGGDGALATSGRSSSRFRTRPRTPSAPRRRRTPTPAVARCSRAAVPFATVTLQGKPLVPSQANNAYVFPGVALGVVAARVTRVTDEMFAQAARTLAGLVSEHDLASGLLFPPLNSIRDVSLKIAVAVARTAHERGFADTTAPRDLEALIREQVFEPEYREYV